MPVFGSLSGHAERKPILSVTSQASVRAMCTLSWSINMDKQLQPHVAN